MTGNIHSIQTFGTVDGPGIRYVLFLQGCCLKCKYCHNRDLWSESAGQQMSVDEVMADILSYKEFYASSGGGVTITGGEPLLQMDFVTALLAECKKHGLHTAVDTSAATVRCDARLDQLLDVTDLFLLDIKQVDDRKHRELTGVSNKCTLAVAKYLSDHGVTTWIRHVVVPGLTMDEETATSVADFVSSLGNVEKVELLPFHQMGSHKWDALGEVYSLKETCTPTASQMEPIKEIFESRNIEVSCAA